MQRSKTRATLAALVVVGGLGSDVAAQDWGIVDGLVIEVLKNRLLAETFARRCDGYSINQEHYDREWSSLSGYLKREGYPNERLQSYVQGEGAEQVIYHANDDLWHNDTSLTDRNTSRFCRAAEDALKRPSWSLYGYLRRS